MGWIFLYNGCIYVASYPSFINPILGGAECKETRYPTVVGTLYSATTSYVRAVDLESAFPRPPLS